MDGIRRLPGVIRPLPRTAKGSLSSATRVVNAVPVQLPNVQRVATLAAAFLRDFRYISE
jgi:hypothetical protein